LENNRNFAKNKKAVKNIIKWIYFSEKLNSGGVLL